MFYSFVFGQEMLSPRCEAESLKLLSDVVAYPWPTEEVSSV